MLFRSVNVVSFRQVLTPDELLGRVVATARTCVLGAFSIGSLLGGAFASAAGLRTTVLVAAGGTFVAAMVLLLSPVRKARRLYEPTAEAGAGDGGDADSAPEAELVVQEQSS